MLLDYLAFGIALLISFYTVLFAIENHRQGNRLGFWAILALALACALVERHRQAEQEAREALRIKPNDPGAHLWLGVALGGDGKAELETALKLDPSLGLGHLFLAVLAAAEGNKEVLAEECRKALALSPADPSPSLLLGMIYTGEGKIDEAVATYKQALIANPRAALAHGALARIYYRRGQKELATFAKAAGGAEGCGPLRSWRAEVNPVVAVRHIGQQQEQPHLVRVAGIGAAVQQGQRGVGHAMKGNGACRPWVFLYPWSIQRGMVAGQFSGSGRRRRIRAQQSAQEGADAP